jgi:hypothetical protein
VIMPLVALTAQMPPSRLPLLRASSCWLEIQTDGM